MFNTQKVFQNFSVNVNEFSLPDKFNFPFYYTPDKLSLMAAEELQYYLSQQNEIEHNFGLGSFNTGLVIGKMFGVMVVKDLHGEIGYLCAYSGKLADSNTIPGFVPPVYDTLSENGFFLKEEAILSNYTEQIIALENSKEYNELINALARLKEEKNKDISDIKNKIKSNKDKRDKIRATLDYENDSIKVSNTLNELNKESYLESQSLKKKQIEWNQLIEAKEKLLNDFTDKITNLKNQRKALSHATQLRIFDEYTFLNINKEKRNLNQIFDNNPPSGAGECAAPKLLQYSFLHNLTPISFAEFWWGASPKGEVRIHKQFYPSCRGKCEPILSFMLEGMNVDVNPMLQDNNYHIQSLKVIYEDEVIVVVDKPAELLSVPGKNITTSVYSILKAMYPHASGPLIVHRLDMSTSGIMIVAKNMEIYKKLQKQFIDKKVEKCYIAIVSGDIKEDSGIINLPLRVDLDNRPQQMVCHQYGKPATTHFEVIERNKNSTIVKFIPITGRTHQLRVHAAHTLGLGTPIIGDDIYGTISDRLMLHAFKIAFIHPITKQKITLTSRPPFVSQKLKIED